MKKKPTRNWHICSHKMSVFLVNKIKHSSEHLMLSIAFQWADDAKVQRVYRHWKTGFGFWGSPTYLSLNVTFFSSFFPSLISWALTLFCLALATCLHFLWNLLSISRHDFFHDPHRFFRERIESEFGLFLLSYEDWPFDRTLGTLFIGVGLFQFSYTICASV